MATQRKKPSRRTRTRPKAKPWAFVVRPGFESELISEIPDNYQPESPAEGIVVASARPSDGSGWSTIAFAQQAMETLGKPIEAHSELLADALTNEINSIYPQKRSIPWTIQVVSPPSSATHDPRRKRAREIDARIAEALDARLDRRIAEAFVDDPAEAERIAQVWLIDEDTAITGFTRSKDCISIFPAGKPHIEPLPDAPSKSGLKLQEAFQWLNLEPSRGETVVDLGAAPGAWAQVMLSYNTKLIAVDRQNLKITLPKKKAEYVQGNAFQFSPSETVDWMLVDMAQRPLDLAKLAAKWGRHSWARQMLISFKMPDKNRVEMLQRILKILTDAGWKGIKARQLYYNKNEVTVFGWLDPKLVQRGRIASFDEMKKRRDAAPKPKGRRNRR